MALSRPAVRQSSFAAGELSPRALGRTDAAAYGSGAAQLRDWVVNPQGSLTRRPGFRYLVTAKALAPVVFTERTNPKNFVLLAVVWAPELSLFVGVGAADGGDSYIVTSPDGISWTERGNPKNFTLNGLAWSGSLFVAVGNADGSDAYIVTSPDGTTWTERANPRNIALNAVVWAPEIDRKSVV